MMTYPESQKKKAAKESKPEPDHTEAPDGNANDTKAEPAADQDDGIFSHDVPGTTDNVAEGM